MTLQQPLDTRLADHLARPVARVVGGAQLVGADLADRAQQVGGELALHVVATRPHVRQHAGQLEAVGLDTAPVIEGQVGGEPHGLEAPPTARRADALAERLRLRVEQHPEGGGGAIGRAQVARHHRDAEGRARRRQHPTLAVEDFASRRLEPHQAHGIALGDALELLALENLELEEAHREDPESQQDGADEEGQPPLDRDLGAGPEHLSPKDKQRQKQKRKHKLKQKET